MNPYARTILHVDDDPAVTALISARLKQHGYETVPLNDPRQAIDRLTSGECRMVLLDIDMPERNGLDLLAEIKQFDGGIQVIMLTGMVSVGTVLRSLRLGAEACLFKPLQELDPLLEALRDAFEKLDRWWASLEDLARRRKQEGILATY